MLKKLILILILALALVYLAGPRVEIDETIHPVFLPDDLDAFLAQQESRFQDLIPHTEKTIVWAARPGDQTEFSLVYVHGFSATRQEVEPLPRLVAEKLGANLYYTRLTGHGRSGQALANASVNDWLNDTRQAFEIGKRLGKKVVMMGASTGGTAVTWLTHHEAKEKGMDDLYACILISPNFKPADPAAPLLTWPWGQKIAELAVGPERHWKGENEGHEQYWTNQYPTKALLPMMGLVKLVDGLDLSIIQQPFLVIYSPKDQVVDADATKKAVSSMASARTSLIPFPLSQDPSHHILAGDILSPNTTAPLADMIYKFLTP